MSIWRSIAAHFGGNVTGDEGERYSSPEDWGTQSDRDSQTVFVKKPWWKRDLSRGKRVIAGLVLGVVIVVLKAVLSTIQIQKAISQTRANQALQTTSVTRSGFGKVSVSDRQRRGV